MSPAMQVWNLVGWLLVAIGLLIVTVTLVRMWFKRDAAKMDRRMRRAGHVPPETDPERTTWVPIVRADEALDHGEHSRGVVRVRFEAYSGRHHLVGVS